MKKEIRDYFKEDENIPQRYAMWNAIFFGAGLVMFGSNKLWLKTACVMIEGLCTYKVTSEMAKFMEVVMKGRVEPPKGIWKSLKCE